MTEQINPDVQRALKALRERAERAEKALMYYEDRQPDVYDKLKWRDAFGQNVAQPRDGLADSIVDATVERLELTGFGARVPGNEAAAAQAEEILKRNRGDELLPRGHRIAGLTRSCGVIVGVNDAGEAVLYVQTAGSTYVDYDPEQPGRVRWAAKVWVDEGTVRLNLYYPERTEAYVSRTNRWTEYLPSLAGAFVPYVVEGKEWPAANPAGIVPVFELRVDRGDLESVYSQIDSANKVLADILQIMDAQGFPVRVLTGVTVGGRTAALGAMIAAAQAATVANPSGSILAAPPAAPSTTVTSPADLKVGPNRILTLANEAAKAIQFDAAALDGPIKLYDKLLLRQASKGKLPLHYVSLIGGSIPSDDTMRQASEAQTAKTKSRQTAFGNAWEDVLAVAVWLEDGSNDQGEWVGNTAPLPALDAVWAPAFVEPGLSAAERVQALIDVGAPAWVVLRDGLGYSEEDARAIGDEIEQIAAVKAEVAAIQFERGLTDSSATDDEG